MNVDSSGKDVCDLCGRDAAKGRPYALLSQVVPRPEKRVSLEPTDTSVLSSETGFKTHEFTVCGRCHGRVPPSSKVGDPCPRCGAAWDI